MRQTIHQWTIHFALLLVLIVGGIYAHHQNTRSERALCSFKDDLRQRRDAGQAYLADLKSGKRVPIPGITQADIQRSIDAQTSTLNSLSGLGC